MVNRYFFKYINLLEYQEVRNKSDYYEEIRNNREIIIL